MLTNELIPNIESPVQRFDAMNEDLRQTG